MRTAGNPIFINRVVLFFKTSPGIQWDISFIKVFMISERITGKKFGIECRSIKSSIAKIRMKRKLKFFTYGFYISMVVWECGLIASMIVENVTMKILLILIPLAIYWFFIIGKGIIEEKIKKFLNTGGKRNLKCALYK